MTARTAEGGPTRETLRSYIGAFMAGLKDTRANPEDVRAVLGEFLGLDMESAQGYLVQWKGSDGLTWVHAHASITTAEDQARAMRGTVTELYGPPEKKEGAC